MRKIFVGAQVSIDGFGEEIDRLFEENSTSCSPSERELVRRERMKREG
jgi:hypothetical protein